MYEYLIKYGVMNSEGEVGIAVVNANSPKEASDILLRNGKFSDYGYNIYNIIQGEEVNCTCNPNTIVSEVNTEKGPKGDKGEKGDKGDPFKYSDFTPEQLDSLKGEKGDKGDKGEKGDRGLQGLKGDTGAKGETGDTGFSPTAKVESTSDGAKVTITDKSGTTTTNITNGVDGFTPSASVETTDNGAIITITDKTGTTTAELDNTIVRSNIDMNSFVSGYLNVGGCNIGNKLSFTVLSSATSRHLILSCNAGDSFILKYSASLANLRAWSFVDKNDILLSKCETALNFRSPITIVAPEGADRVILQCSNWNTTTYSVKQILHNITDAPKDGNGYVRKDGEWVEEEDYRNYFLYGNRKTNPLVPFSDWDKVNAYLNTTYCTKSENYEYKTIVLRKGDILLIRKSGNTGISVICTKEPISRITGYSSTYTFATDYPTQIVIQTSYAIRAKDDYVYVNISTKWNDENIIFNELIVSRSDSPVSSAITTDMWDLLKGEKIDLNGGEAKSLIQAVKNNGRVWKDIYGVIRTDIPTSNKRKEVEEIYSGTAFLGQTYNQYERFIFGSLWNDFSSISYCFYQHSNLLYFDGNILNKFTASSIHGAFYACTALTRVDGRCLKGTLTGDNTTNSCFSSANLIVVDFRNDLDFSQIPSAKMAYSGKIETLIGDYQGTDAVVYNGIKVSLSLSAMPKLDRYSLRAVINGLADLTETDSKTLTLGSTLRAKLEQEDIDIAISKNWIIA